MPQPNTQIRQGVLYALSAYGLWGIAPIYFKQLGAIDAFEILSHRVIWSCVFIAILLFITKGWGQVHRVLQNPRQLLVLFLTSLLIGANWLTYIWAINNDHLLEASLGYFINPLVNVVVGMIFLQERFRRLQWFAVILAALGVAVEIIKFGSLPWIAITLAFTFSFYGLLRKQLKLGALSGLCIETTVLLPIALIYLTGFDHSTSRNLLNNPLPLDLLLISAGIVTTVPLLFFAGAATRLRLSTLGFFQYIAPTLMFLLAVIGYSEPFSIDKLITFGFIWVALVIFVIDATLERRRRIGAP
ncbi:EamA family transporter RarD [Celerinatantimonas diazotrophica]|uniref:Chloramphenicol-sensitive protein RarD n=1 Tax=Celerinatantimonas diazotrophica TaxID=412034 RepID=A0A4R1KGZ2_9GAMM|nr:EamA family transporter RarD [Celerinatantimonas diazotrophica]TCK63323.1 chloramphenicol-sensitive protein RarD [Celerinatantimonas diazotrophica]CAG9298467.1 Protein RarD [Celerinatantimonas diazotrophica]